ncbi:MAG: hypothetical protein GDA51_08095 [Ekhidna sp.]|nr:hypothetical protein [Ekhidna sp.]
MTLTQIQELNESFQKRSVQLSELIPSSGMVQVTSVLLRSSRQIHKAFVRLLNVSSEEQFNKTIDIMEEEIDEVVYTLDQLEIANKKQQISLVEDFLKEGYRLMSVYSKCCDYIIERKVAGEE